MSAFFAADIEHAALPAETSGHLQKQRAFADARIAADENGAAWHQTASQHTVQLLIACGGPGHGTFLYLAQWNGFGFLGGLIPGRLFGGLAGNGDRGDRFALLKGIPLAAVRAAAQPARGLIPAGSADIAGFFLGQGDTPVLPPGAACGCRGGLVLIIPRGWDRLP